MALADVLQTAAKNSLDLDAEATEQYIKDHIKDFQDLIAYWRVYPDRLVDYYLTLGNPANFKFFYYQRLFLRAIFRYKITYATFVRAWSKSFMSDMALMLKCILYPGANIFTVAAGKEQSAEILSSKVAEICRLIPAIGKEIIWDTRGTQAKTTRSKDSVIYTFTNGSTLRNVAASERTRGQRYNAGLAA